MIGVAQRDVRILRAEIDISDAALLATGASGAQPASLRRRLMARLFRGPFPTSIEVYRGMDIGGRISLFLRLAPRLVITFKPMTDAPSGVRVVDAPLDLSGDAIDQGLITVSSRFGFHWGAPSTTQDDAFLVGSSADSSGGSKSASTQTARSTITASARRFSERARTAGRVSPRPTAAPKLSAAAAPATHGPRSSESAARPSSGQLRPAMDARGHVLSSVRANMLAALRQQL